MAKIQPAIPQGHVPFIGALAAGGLMLLAGCQFDGEYDPQPAPVIDAPMQASAPASVGASAVVPANLDDLAVPAASSTAASSTPLNTEPSAPPAVSLPALHLTVQQAVVRALENNASFQVDRFAPPIHREAEEIQRAAFDPTLTAGLSAGQAHDRADQTVRGANAGTRTSDGNAVDLTAGVRQRLPTGTEWEANLGANYQDDRSAAGSRNRELRWDATVTQALLKGGSTDANYASLRQARIDTRISEYELRGAAETLVAQVEKSYWETVLAERSIAIYEQSLAVAEQQVAEVKERIAVGKVAASDLVAAEAESASRREQLIDARGQRAKAKLALQQRLGVDPSAGAWDRELALTEVPETTPLTLESADTHAAVAIHSRADLNQARLQIQRGELEVVRTRDGLLPALDLFVTLGGSRYAAAFSALPDSDGRSLKYTAGLNLAYPLGNRDAAARHTLARLSDEQNHAALRTMEDLVQVEVRSAHVDVQSAAEKIAASSATRALRAQTLAVETERFRVGKSTSFQVAQAQRDLVASQIAELEAVVRYRQALLELYRLEGSLLQRRGIQPAGVP